MKIDDNNKYMLINLFIYKLPLWEYIKQELL